MSIINKTIKVRIKGNTTWLVKLSNEVNFVWNYVNDLSFKMIKDRGIFLSAYDMHPYLVGCTGEDGLSLLMHSIQEVAEQYASKRKQSKLRKLRWRSKKSLGWVPFKSGDIKIKKKCLCYNGKKFKVWDSYGLNQYKFRSGSFNQDSKGNWYLNMCVDVNEEKSCGAGQVGIDLGLKDFAVLSNGEKVESMAFYRKDEEKLKTAQRARKKNRYKAIHAKIKNKRKDFLQKLSTRLVKENRLIIVGNVNSSALAKTNMAKSVYDAGWGMFKTMLEYKAIRQQVVFMVVNEAWTTQTCSVCKNRTGPKGLEGLVIREWICSDCGSSHDRDVNAAKNILALGQQRLAEGIPDKGSGQNPIEMNSLNNFQLV